MKHAGVEHPTSDHVWMGAAHRAPPNLTELTDLTEPESV